MTRRPPKTGGRGQGEPTVTADRHNLESAKFYAHEGRTEQWLREHLTEGSAPNARLWEKIESRRGVWIGPVEVRLETLRRSFGSASEARQYDWINPPGEADDEWDRRVEALCALGPAVLGLAPLIVRYVGNVFVVTDGGHRHEALRRMDFVTCWALIEMKTEHLGD